MTAASRPWQRYRVDPSDWTTWHHAGIGASEWGSVLGYNPHAGPHRVWRDKRGLSAPFDETEAMELGHEFEEIIVRRACAKLGVTVLDLHGQVCLERRDLASWARATLDYIVETSDGPMVIECKSTGQFIGPNDMPEPSWRFQLAAQQWVSGVERGAIAALCPTRGGLGVRVWRRDFDPALVAVAKPLLDQFWALVESGVPPILDGSDDAEDTLRALYPRGTEGAVDLTDETADMAREYDRARQELADAEKAKNALGQRIKESLGLAVEGRSGNVMVRWSNVVGRKGVDTAKLKAEFPEVFETVAKTGEPTRRMTVMVGS